MSNSKAVNPIVKKTQETYFLCLDLFEANKLFLQVLPEYLLVLLIFIYILTRLVNYSGISNYKYDVKTTLYATSLFLIACKFLCSFISFACSPINNMIFAISCSMVILAYMN